MAIAFGLIVVGLLIAEAGRSGRSIADVLNGISGAGFFNGAGPKIPTISFSELGAGVNVAAGSTVGALTGGGGEQTNAQPGIPVSQLTSVGPLHPTDGLAGYPAHDYFAPAGSPCVSPVDGRVTKLSGHDPASGPTSGPHGPFGLSVYIQGGGHSYYLTHMGSRSVNVGDIVRQGQQIGTVGDYAKWGGANHIHMGVH